MTDEELRKKFKMYECKPELGIDYCRKCPMRGIQVKCL